MHRNFGIYFFISCCFFVLRLSAQSKEKESPYPFYWGAHVGSPLFWGDLFSTGTSTNLGLGAGLHAGYRPNHWFGVELGLDMGRGKLTPRSWQRDDLIDENGQIRYVTGSYTLDEIQSETRFLRVGARVPLQLMNLFSGRERRFNVELAPHYYLQKFDPRLLLTESGDIWSSGARPKPWSYSLGGDVALNYQIRPKTAIFLKSAASWLSDDRFEGVSTYPAWRVNVQLFTSIGIRLSFGKRQATDPITTNGHTSTAQQVTAQAKPVEERLSPTKPPIVTSSQQPVPTDTSGRPEINQHTPDDMAVLYFDLNSAQLDERRYAKHLQQILLAVQQHPDAQLHIHGWADRSGSTAQNNDLSAKRAQVVANYFVRHGVSATRIYQQGLGEDHIRTIRKAGRRVEIRIRTQPH